MIGVIKQWLTRLFSRQDDYRGAIAALGSAVSSGLLRQDDSAAEGLAVVEKAAGYSLTEGIDWIEVELYAKEHNIKVKTVGDLLELFGIMTREVRT